MTLTLAGPLADKLLEEACEKYADTLLAHPNDYRALYNWAVALSRLAQSMARQKLLTKAHSLFQKAARKYKRYAVTSV